MSTQDSPVMNTFPASRSVFKDRTNRPTSLGNVGPSSALKQSNSAMRSSFAPVPFTVNRDIYEPVKNHIADSQAQMTQSLIKEVSRYKLEVESLIRDKSRIQIVADERGEEIERLLNLLSKANAEIARGLAMQQARDDANEELVRLLEEEVQYSRDSANDEEVEPLGSTSPVLSTQCDEGMKSIDSASHASNIISEQANEMRALALSPDSSNSRINENEQENTPNSNNSGYKTDEQENESAQLDSSPNSTNSRSISIKQEKMLDLITSTDSNNCGTNAAERESETRELISSPSGNTDSVSSLNIQTNDNDSMSIEETSPNSSSVDMNSFFECTVKCEVTKVEEEEEEEEEDEEERTQPQDQFMDVERDHFSETTNSEQLDSHSDLHEQESEIADAVQDPKISKVKHENYTDVSVSAAARFKPRALNKRRRSSISRSRRSSGVHAVPAGFLGEHDEMEDKEEAESCSDNTDSNNNRNKQKKGISSPSNNHQVNDPQEEEGEQQQQHSFGDDDATQEEELELGTCALAALPRTRSTRAGHRQSTRRSSQRLAPIPAGQYDDDYNDNDNSDLSEEQNVVQSAGLRLVVEDEGSSENENVNFLEKEEEEEEEEEEELAELAELAELENENVNCLKKKEEEEKRKEYEKKKRANFQEKPMTRARRRQSMGAFPKYNEEDRDQQSIPAKTTKSKRQQSLSGLALESLSDYNDTDGDDCTDNCSSKVAQIKRKTTSTTSTRRQSLGGKSNGDTLLSLSDVEGAEGELTDEQQTKTKLPKSKRRQSFRGKPNGTALLSLSDVDDDNEAKAKRSPRNTDQQMKTTSTKIKRRKSLRGQSNAVPLHKEEEDEENSNERTSTSSDQRVKPSRPPARKNRKSIAPTSTRREALELKQEYFRNSSPLSNSTNEDISGNESDMNAENTGDCSDENTANQTRPSVHTTKSETKSMTDTYDNDSCGHIEGSESGHEYMTLEQVIESRIPTNILNSLPKGLISLMSDLDVRVRDMQITESQPACDEKSKHMNHTDAAKAYEILALTADPFRLELTDTKRGSKKKQKSVARKGGKGRTRTSKGDSQENNDNSNNNLPKKNKKKNVRWASADLSSVTPPEHDDLLSVERVQSVVHSALEIDDLLTRGRIENSQAFEDAAQALMLVLHELMMLKNKLLKNKTKTEVESMCRFTARVFADAANNVRSIYACRAEDLHLSVVRSLMRRTFNNRPDTFRFECAEPPKDAVDAIGDGCVSAGVGSIWNEGNVENVSACVHHAMEVVGLAEELTVVETGQLNKFEFCASPRDAAQLFMALPSARQLVAGVVALCEGEEQVEGTEKKNNQNDEEEEQQQEEVVNLREAWLKLQSAVTLAQERKFQSMHYLYPLAAPQVLHKDLSGVAQVGFVVERKEQQQLDMWLGAMSEREGVKITRVILRRMKDVAHFPSVLID